MSYLLRHPGLGSALEVMLDYLIQNAGGWGYISEVYSLRVGGAKLASSMCELGLVW